MNHLLNSEYEDYSISYFICNNDYWLPFSESEHDSFERTDGGYGYTRSDYGDTGVTGDFGTSLNRIIKTDASGYFDTTFVLEQPMYFNISRNILYLSPGDDLEVYLTPDTRQATFKGKGSEAQLFLKRSALSQGGLFSFVRTECKGEF